jgi:membrane protein implicated in regulation of membrane protease activity
VDLTLIAYWICFLVGTGYTFISALLTGFFGMFDHGGEIGGDGGGDMAGGGDYGADIGNGVGHGAAHTAGAEGEAVISPLSPATIAIFMTTFGGVGIILHSLFHLGLLLSLPISAASGIAVASFVALVFYHLFTRVQASSETRMAEIIGLTAEVTVPIPAEGMGEIAYVCRGARLVAGARSRSGRGIPRHQAVRIMQQVGNTLYVEPHPLGRAEPAAPPSDDRPIRD